MTGYYGALKVTDLQHPWHPWHHLFLIMIQEAVDSVRSYR